MCHWLITLSKISQTHENLGLNDFRNKNACNFARGAGLVVVVNDRSEGLRMGEYHVKQKTIVRIKYNVSVISIYIKNWNVL